MKTDGQNPGEHEGFARNLAKWFEAGVTRPELCFVFEENAVIKGGIAIAASPGVGEINILDLSLSPGSFHSGTELINKSLERLGASKSIRACYHLYNDTEEYNDYKQCFIDAGFSIAQEKLSYRYSGNPPARAEIGLEFRSYAEAGEDAFLEAVALVSEKTLDRIIAASAARLGKKEAARALAGDLKELDFQPEIWTLACLDGELAGLVVPANFGDGYGGINYIGVVPPRRGHGYVDALISEGTRLLLEQDVSTVIADIDTLNFPMKNALSRVGYEFAYEMVALEKVIGG